MEKFVDAVETQLGDLVNRISRYEPIEEAVSNFAKLDELLLATMTELREHYAASRRLEQLRDEGQSLDSNINSILVELAQCRKDLEAGARLREGEEDPMVPEGSASLTGEGDEQNGQNATGGSSVDSQLLLEYATKITRFTHKLPGSENALPWPSEDQLRRGMLALLATNGSSESSEEHGHNEEMEGVNEDQLYSKPPEHDPADATGAKKESIATASSETSSVSKSSSRRPAAKISLDMDSDSD